MGDQGVEQMSDEFMDQQAHAFDLVLLLRAADEFSAACRGFMPRNGEEVSEDMLERATEALCGEAEYFASKHLERT